MLEWMEFCSTNSKTLQMAMESTWLVLALSSKSLRQAVQFLDIHRSDTIGVKCPHQVDHAGRSANSFVPLTPSSRKTFTIFISCAAAYSPMAFDWRIKPSPSTCPCLETLR